MTKYLVKTTFYDRLNNMQLVREGELHSPPTQERAQQLIDGGYLDPTPIDDPPESTPGTAPPPTSPGSTDDPANGLPEGLTHMGGGYYELPNGEKVRGKEKAIEALAALQLAGDA